MVDKLIASHPIVTDQITKQELRVLLQSLQSVVDRGVEGDVVELGCYKGTAALFMQRLLDELGSPKRLYLYDSFAGLPPKTDKDASPVGEQFVTGELLASRHDVIQNFRKARLRQPHITKGWFHDLEPDDMPDQICLAFLDGDYYESIRDSLRLIEGRLADGSMVVVDDYASEALPGAARAVDEWVRHRGLEVRVAHSLAVISIGGH